MRTDLCIAALACAAALDSTACGFCIEDRVAAVYDSASVEKAIAGHRYVAFLSVEGEEPLDAATQRTLTKALEAAGAVRGATRIAGDNAACAVVYDPKKTTLERLVAAAGRALAALNRPVKAVRIIDDGGKLREP